MILIYQGCIYSELARKQNTVEMKISNEVSLWYVDNNNDGEVKKDVTETISRQALTITAYERIIGNHCLVISEYEKKMKEIQADLCEKEKTVQELSRINLNMCSALAKIRSENDTQEKDLRKKERDIVKLSSENKVLKSFRFCNHEASKMSNNNTNCMHNEFQEMKKAIEQAKCALLSAMNTDEK
jgi:hypothetical protein